MFALACYITFRALELPHLYIPEEFLRIYTAASTLKNLESELDL